MASPSCNTHFDHSQVPDGYGWAMSNFDYSQYVPVTYQSSTSILAEPSIASADLLLHTHPVQYPTASVGSGFPISSALPSTCSGMCSFNQNAIHQPPNHCEDRASALGYVGPRHGTACTNLPASTSSVRRTSRVEATNNSYARGKRASGRNQGRHQRQERAHRSFQCHWRDCTYHKPFSGKPALMRHIDTQHITPRSFDCPSCDMSFNRKDNMTEHRGRVHLERV